MKHLTISLIILLSVNIYCQAQLVSPINMREKYITRNYQLTPKDINTYNNVLQTIEVKWRDIKSTKLPITERKNKETKLAQELCSKVKNIFSEIQYKKWHTNHRGNLSVRFYKEDLGMTSDQFTEFRKASTTYSNTKQEIQTQNLSKTEHSEQRKRAFNQYVSSMHALFPIELANHLIRENQVLNIATNLSGNYTIISESKAIQYAQLKMKYDKDKEELDAQQLNPKLMKQKRLNLETSYEASLRLFLTNEEYMACDKKRDKLTDQRNKHFYNMTTAQLSQYKELKKKLAIKRLQIKQSKIEKATKTTKLQEAETTFEAQLKKVLTTQQYDKWKRDALKKIDKNKK